MAYLARPGEQEEAPVLYVGREVERALGYPREAWAEDPAFWSSHLHPEDRDRARAWWAAVQAGAVPVGRPGAIEYRMLSRDGRAVWFRDRAVLRPDGVIYRVMLDVTEEHEALERARRAEQERRRLLAAMVGAEERERQRIALDLHDGPVQWLTAAALRLRGLGGLLADPGPRSAAEEVVRLLDRTTRSLRGLLFDLHPPVLEREGLVPALRDHLAGLSQVTRGSLDCRLEGSLGAEPPPRWPASRSGSRRKPWRTCASTPTPARSPWRSPPGAGGSCCGSRTTGSGSTWRPPAGSPATSASPRCGSGRSSPAGSSGWRAGRARGDHGRGVAPGSAWRAAWKLRDRSVRRTSRVVSSHERLRPTAVPGD